MPELIERYAEKFNENFPLFALMGMDDEEVDRPTGVEGAEHFGRLCDAMDPQRGQHHEP